MSAPLPPLSSIRCFEAASRHGSFTRAADELGMTQAAVSYQIKLLEDRLGTALFNRGPRGVSLTEVGKRLSPMVVDAFKQLRAAFEDLHENADGVLSITTINTFAANWLVPRLGEFHVSHPEIAVRLDVSSRMADFDSDGFDVGIRAGSGDWPGLVVHKLMDLGYVPMLSPTLLAQTPRLNSPSDLLQLPLIDPGDSWWVDWFQAVGVPSVDLSRRTEMRINTQHLAGSAALAGHGVAILTPELYADELASGRLVQPFPSVRYAGSSYWLVYPERRRRSAKIRAFRDWLLGKFESSAGSPVQTSGDRRRGETG